MPRTPKNRIAGEFFVWSLFERDGVIYADGRANTPNLGKHSLGTRDREAALRALHELDRRKAVEQKLAQPRSLDAGDCDPIAIADGWARYLEHVGRPAVLHGATAKTQARYAAVRDKHIEHSAKRRLTHWRQVTTAEVREYGTYLAGRGYADSTVYLECTLLKQVVGWLIKEGLLPETSRVHLKLKRSHETTTFCFSREQVKAMVERCRSLPELHWLADAIVGLATTGMRISELASLRWSDIDLTSGVITVAENRHSSAARSADAVRTTKSRRSRRIDIHAQLRALLIGFPHRAQGGHVFRALQGGPLDADKVLKVLKRDVIGPLVGQFPTPAGEIGFVHGRLHSFRHYFVSEAFAGGASEAEIRDWVGHRDSRMVERYRHRRGTAAKRTMSQLNFLDEEPHGKPPASQDNRADDGGAGQRDANVANLERSRETDGSNGSATQ